MADQAAAAVPDRGALIGVPTRPVPEAKTGKNRVHLDVAAELGEDQWAALAVLRAAGAVPADVGQGPVSWIVLADPEGSEFCLLSPL